MTLKPGDQITVLFCRTCGRYYTTHLHPETCECGKSLIGAGIAVAEVKTLGQAQLLHL
jgi:hypothetical protein